MAVTELKRKTRTNRARPNNDAELRKHLLKKPVIRKIDVEAIKAEFEAAKA